MEASKKNGAILAVAIGSALAAAVSYYLLVLKKKEQKKSLPEAEPKIAEQAPKEEEVITPTQESSKKAEAVSFIGKALNASEDFKKFNAEQNSAESKHLESATAALVEAEEESITAIDYTSLQSSYVELESSTVHEEDDFGEEDFEMDHVEVTQSIVMGQPVVKQIDPEEPKTKSPTPEPALEKSEVAPALERSFESPEVTSALEKSEEAPALARSFESPDVTSALEKSSPEATPALDSSRKSESPEPALEQSRSSSGSPTPGPAWVRSRTPSRSTGKSQSNSRSESESRSSSTSPSFSQGQQERRSPKVTSLDNAQVKNRSRSTSPEDSDKEN